jgi:uncharacterized protein (TIRG00374 family)
VVGTVAVVGAAAVAAVRVGPRTVGRRILRVSAAGRRQAYQGLAQFSGVVREPARAAKLWLGSASVPVLHAVIVIAVYRSIGGVAPMMAIAVTYLAASALAGIIPSPGGLGTLDVTLVAGLVALGTPAATALAVTLGYRLITVWVPMLPGAVVFAVLVRRGVI